MMRVVERGSGPPLVLVPSLQGRWEYLRRAVDALAVRNRVMTFSLCDERGWELPSGASATLDDFAHQIDLVLDASGVESAAVCGFSFGGRIALRFAARRPERVSALILASTPGPGWHLKRAHRTYARHPLMLAPAFFAGAPSRVRRELNAAFPNRRERMQFAAEQLRTFARAPLSPSRMAARALLIDGADVLADCARISVPTLIINGEPSLDHVVPTTSTAGFNRVIPHARLAVIPRTGHFGCVTRPGVFAEAVDAFLTASRRSQIPESVEGSPRGEAPRMGVDAA
jgi:pimeloyl-ACP methyl ester carboxylesterase